jgi:hypothetical protein
MKDHCRSSFAALKRLDEKRLVSRERHREMKLNCRLDKVSSIK